MTHAILHGKLRSSSTYLNDQLEDLLTSEVFGRLRYLSLNKGLLPLLERAQNAGNKKYGLSVPANLSGLASYKFWPRFTLRSGTAVEPDLTIEFTMDNAIPFVIVVECKHRSRKSQGPPSEDKDTDLPASAPRDQLVKELLASKEKYPKSNVILLYITGHSVIPEVELKESSDNATDFIGMEENYFYNNTYWLGWKEIWRVLNNQKKSLHNQLPTNIVIDDLTKLLEYHGYRFYEGIPKPDEPIQVFSLPVWYLSGFKGWSTCENLMDSNESIIYYKRS